MKRDPRARKMWFRWSVALSLVIASSTVLLSGWRWAPIVANVIGGAAGVFIVMAAHLQGRIEEARSWAKAIANEPDRFVFGLNEPFKRVTRE